MDTVGLLQPEKRSDEDQFLLFNLLPYELGKFKEVERILILIAKKRLL